MALQITHGQLQSINSRFEGLKSKYKNAIEKSKGVVEKAVRTAEVGAAAFTAGVVQGKYNGVEVLGVPVDLGAGVAAHLMGFAGVGGELSSHLHNFGDGFLASYLTTTGRGVGKNWAAKKTGVHGELVEGRDGAQGLSDDELARLANRR